MSNGTHLFLFLNTATAVMHIRLNLAMVKKSTVLEQDQSGRCHLFSSVMFSGERGVLITGSKAVDLQFGNLLLIGELGTVDTGTRTAHSAQPRLPTESQTVQTVRCLFLISCNIKEDKTFNFPFLTQR